MTYCAFVIIRAHPRYPWLKTFCSPAFALVLVGLEDSTAPYSNSKFWLGSSIVAQMLSSLLNLVIRDRRLDPSAKGCPVSRNIVVDLIHCVSSSNLHQIFIISHGLVDQHVQRVQSDRPGSPC